MSSVAPSMTALAHNAAVVLADLRQLGALLDIKTKQDGIIRFSYDRWHREQRRYQRERTRRDVILKPRQIGFTTLELARDVQFARVNDGVQVLIVAQDSDLAEVLFQAAHLMVEALVRLGLAPKPKFSNKREVVFGDNHSAIRVVEAGATEASAAKKGRSGTIHRLHATEVAFWGAAQETMVALTAAVPDAGEIVVESTPNGASGLFYEMCTTAIAGSGEYRMHFFPWYEHDEYRREVLAGFNPAPRDEDEQKLREAGCDDEQIAWWRSLVDDPARGGREKVKQEYPINPRTCFRMPGGAYISAEAVDALEFGARTPRQVHRLVVKGRQLGDLLIYDEPIIGERYIVGADVAEGTGLDNSAADVTRRLDGSTVASFATDSLEAGDFGLALAAIGRLYGDALIAPERNNHGHATLRTLQHEETEVTPYPHIYKAEDGKPGWATTPATRPILFDDLRMAIEDRCVVIPDAATAAEARTIVRDKSDGKPRAQGKGTAGGSKDDRFIAKAIAWQVRERSGSTTVARVTNSNERRPRAWGDSRRTNHRG